MDKETVVEREGERDEEDKSHRKKAESCSSEGIQEIEAVQN